MTDTRRISKTLSYWLRHDPAAGGLTLDASGWTDVQAVLAALARKGVTDRLEDLLRTVEENDKQRFELSADHRFIRARQGHSVEVDLCWPVAEPPETLFHGTVARFLDAIMTEGLKPMKRHHVHLSPDARTATAVGARRGEAVILEIDAGEMHRRGTTFRLSANGVWLVDHVPPAFIRRT